MDSSYSTINLDSWESSSYYLLLKKKENNNLRNKKSNINEYRFIIIFVDL